MLNLEPPPAKYACSDSCYLFIALWCCLANIFHVLTCTAAMYHVAEFLDEE